MILIDFLYLNDKQHYFITTEFPASAQATRDYPQDFWLDLTLDSLALKGSAIVSTWQRNFWILG